MTAFAENMVDILEKESRFTPEEAVEAKDRLVLWMKAIPSHRWQYHDLPIKPLEKIK